MKRLCLHVMLVAFAVGLVVEGLLAQVPPPGTQVNADLFFDDAVLHDIHLDINGQDWQALKDHPFDNTYYPSEFRWRDQRVRNIGIRSRGTGSRSGTKPGLRVDFDRYAPSQKFLGLKSFILRNNTQDASNLNERLTMLLYRRMGVPASREAHTRLFVNDQYVGLYTIVESVDKAFLQRTYGDDQGYLYDYDYPVGAQPYFFEYRGSDPSQYVPLPFKPDTHESSPKPEFIEELIRTINETSDEVFRVAISEFVGLVSFIRHVAVEVFVADNDGFLGDYGTNNFYFHRFDNQKLFTFIPWDKSEAFKSGYEYSIFHNLNDVPSWLQNRLMTRVLKEPDLYQVFLDTLVECADLADDRSDSEDGRGWLEREIEKEYEQIREAALTDPFKPFGNDDFERAVSALGEFARRRGEFVRNQVALARDVKYLRRGQ